MRRLGFGSKTLFQSMLRFGQERIAIRGKIRGDFNWSPREVPEIDIGDLCTTILVYQQGHTQLES